MECDVLLPKRRVAPSTKRGKVAWAGVCAAISGATREVGVLTMLGLAILYLEQIGFAWRKIRLNILWILLGAIGIVGYMAFLWLRFGNPLQFMDSHVNSAWQIGADSKLALDALRQFLSVKNIRNCSRD